MDTYTLLVITHIIGTVLGVGGATFAEILYLRASRDGKIDEEEGATLKVTYFVLRIGLSLAVLSGFGFLVFYRLNGFESALLDPKLWAKMTIVAIILLNAVLLSARKIPLWLGSPISLVSWYSALVLGSWRNVPYSYIEIMFGYIVIVIVASFILSKIRKRMAQ
jgi:uncharacterized membrane protein